MAIASMIPDIFEVEIKSEQETVREEQIGYSDFDNPDYCSFCAFMIPKMKNHEKAHQLRAQGEYLKAYEFY